MRTGLIAFDHGRRGARTGSRYRVSAVFSSRIARRLLAPITQHLVDGALGTISELFDGDPPHAPRGCFAQARAVAEIARVWIEEGL